MVFATASNLPAADDLSASAMNKTIIASLQPVIKLFSGNAWLQGIAVILVTSIELLLFFPAQMRVCTALSRFRMETYFKNKGRTEWLIRSFHQCQPASG